MQHLARILRYTLWQRLLIMLLCCSALFVGTSTVSFGSSRQPPNKAASFGLLPYGSSQQLNKAYFLLHAHPGEYLQEQMRVTNAGNITGTAKLTPVDATTAQNSGIVYLNPGSARRNVGSWVTMSTQEVTLAPGQSKVVALGVSVPQNASSGQHVGGIVAQDMALQHTTSSSGTNTFQIAIQHVTIVPIELILPGPRIEQLVAKGIQIGGYNSAQTVNINLQNTGNAIVKPSGTLQVTDTNGTVLQKFTITMDMFLPQTSINYSTYVQGKALGVGYYLASVQLNYGNGQFLNYATNFAITQQQLQRTFGTPPGLQTPWGIISLPLWAIILIILVALIVLFIIGQKIYGLIMAHRRKKAKDAQEQAKAKDAQEQAKAKDAQEQTEDSHEQLGDQHEPINIFCRKRNKTA
jgi:hypothetical protein